MIRAALICLIAGMVTPAMAKTGRTYHSPERIAAAKANIERYEWAKKELAAIMETAPPGDTMGSGETRYIGARRMVNKSDDQLFAMMPPITIPRNWSVDPTSTCPAHGTQIRARSGYYPWLVDFENHPYKVICPVGREMYPSNDFAAGDLTSGDYPDDGSGCEIDGKRYEFVMYYTHRSYLQWVIPTARSLSEAYVLTGDPRYAQKCAILLAAVAAQFPGPKYHSDLCYDGPYGRRSGAVTDYIWECGTIVPLATAYDSIFPALDDPDLLAFLRAKGLPADTATELAEFIEDHLFRQAMQGLLDGALAGNPGHHQKAAAVMALVMDDYSDNHPNSHDMMRFAWYAGYAPTGWVMSNYLTRDGGGYEGPGYDKIKFEYVRVAEIMDRLRALHPEVYTEEEFPRVMDEPKARAMYDYFMDAVAIGFFTPEIGDAGGARLRPGFIPARQYTLVAKEYAAAFRRYGDPRYARALLGPERKMPTSDLFEPSVEDDARRAAELPEARIQPRTRLIDHSGLAFLRGAEGQRARAAVLNYAALRGHHQYDYLSLFLFANEMSHLPDLGYPFSWEYRWQWDANLYAHNTVTVDGTAPLHPTFVPRGWVSLIADGPSTDGLPHFSAVAAAHEPYWPHPELEPYQPPVRRYERICVLVNDSAGDSYLVDLFVIAGGRRHDQSWHGVLRELELPALDWIDQPAGTAAGPDIPFDGKYVNVRGQEVQDGLCYITGVKRATLDEPAAFHWDHGLEEPAGTRLHLVPLDGPKGLIFGGGRSPVRPEEWNLPFVFVRHEDASEAPDDQLVTRFLSILEPYRGIAASRITGIEASGEWPLTITVTRGDAVDTISIHAPSAADGISRGGRREIGVEVTTALGEATRSGRIGSLPGTEGGAVNGVIVALDRDANTVTVDAVLPPLAEQTGWARIFSEGRSSMYSVVACEPMDDGRTLLRLGETSLLGRGIPVAYRDGVIENDAPLPFATGRVEDGEMLDFARRHAGARVENADRSVSYRLRGVDGAQWINGSSDYDLYLEDAVSAAHLEAALGAPAEGRRFAIHDYGVGDSFEIMLRSR